MAAHLTEQAEQAYNAPVEEAQQFEEPVIEQPEQVDYYAMAQAAIVDGFDYSDNPEMQETDIESFIELELF